MTVANRKNSFSWLKALILALVAIAITAFFLLGGPTWFDFNRLDELHERVRALAESRPVLFPTAYVSIYALSAALSLPIAGAMTLLGGALFGLLKGTALASLASVSGATLAFIGARWLFMDAVRTRYAKQLQAINRGVDKDGAFFLFAVRMMPLFPFFVVNLAAAATSLRLAQFVIASTLGMLPMTAVFVFIGTQLALITSPDDIVSLGLLSALALAGLAPLLLSKLIRRAQKRRRLKGWKKPARRDANLIIIGGGAAGLVAALIATALKAKAILIEKERMGGDCLNTGCVPSKSLLSQAALARRFTTLDPELTNTLKGQAGLDKAITRARETIASIAPHDSVERFESLGVSCIKGDAKIVSPWEVETDGQRISANAIIIASGAEPALPNLPGLDSVDYLDSESIWDLEQIPDQLVIIGGGFIACELGQGFARLGAQVTLVARSELLPGEDRDTVEWLRRQLQKEEINILENCATHGVNGRGRAGELQSSLGSLPFHALLIAIGRKPRSDFSGLKEIGVETGKTGEIIVDEFMQTSVPTIYACGDVIGAPFFTHASSREAVHTTVNTLFGSARRMRMNYKGLPRALFTDPELARVGLNEREAEAANEEFEVTRYPLAELDRALIDGYPEGEIKLLTRGKSDKLIGASIVGHNASSMLAPFALAMQNGIGLKKLGNAWLPYPSQAEACVAAANQWRREHTPQGALRWMARWHRLRRRERAKPE